MKTCNSCKEEKELSDFHFKKSESRFQSICKKCFSKYCMNRWTERKKLAVEYKGGCCVYCGYNKSLAALEFHHVNPSEKEFNWNKMRLVSDSKMRAELDKCILLCANCHREEHQK